MSAGKDLAALLARVKDVDLLRLALNEYEAGVEGGEAPVFRDELIAQVLKTCFERIDALEALNKSFLQETWTWRARALSAETQNERLRARA